MPTMRKTSWRLPATFWCYDPLGAQTPVGALPAAAEGRTHVRLPQQLLQGERKGPGALGPSARRRSGFAAASRYAMKAVTGGRR